MRVIMGVKRGVLDFFTSTLKGGIKIVSAGQASRVLAHLSEQLVPKVEIAAGEGNLKFYCPNLVTEWRARTLLTKEPETISWIDGFKQGEIFWDVGANIGVYTLYAALKGLTVLSFEPAPGNYYVLSRNIEINGFGERVSSFCLAFNDETLLESFHMSTTDLGGATSSFGEAVDWKGESYIPIFKQSMIGFSIDDFIELFRPAFPNHLKIDVDGIERKIIIGASQTLSDSRLKTILIELNIKLDECQEIVKFLEGYGFMLREVKHAESFYTGEMASIYNHIFIRKA